MAGPSGVSGGRKNYYQRVEPDPPKLGFWQWFKGLFSPITDLFKTKVVSTKDHENKLRSTSSLPVITPSKTVTVSKEESQGITQKGGVVGWVNENLNNVSNYLDGKKEEDDLLPSNSSRGNISKDKTGASTIKRTQDALNERGDKLNQLGDKTKLMQSEAGNFADLAKKLREKEENKSWWEF